MASPLVSSDKIAVMMSAKPAPPEPSKGPAAAIARHLQEGDEVIRCLAARAIGKVGGPVAADALVAALMDEDADVRSDAMTALLGCARPEDAPDIRRSLIGDPVPEIKVVAIRVLAGIGDRASIPLLRSLARDRAEDQVVWEDEATIWDEWLDVQLAAVAALGDLGATEAIEDLQAARSDEMGQDLDAAVFAALAAMPDGGIAALIGFLRDHDPRVRARALSALARTDGEILLPMSDLLLADANPEVRLLAIGCLPGDDTRLVVLARQDPVPGLRRDALLRSAAAGPESLFAALADPDEEVRAVALEQIAARGTWPETDDLSANLLAWMQTSGERLAAVSASCLAQRDPKAAAAALLSLAADAARPQGARTAALRALDIADVTDAQGLRESLRDLVIDAARPIRTAALAALARWCDDAAAPAERQVAEALIGQAIDGQLCDATGGDGEQSPGAAGAAASKVEDGGSQRISITPDGEIVDEEERAQAPEQPQQVDDTVVRFPRSTLEAIQAPIEAPSSESDVELTAEDLSFLALTQKGRRRQRVSVDGPADIADDIRIVALQVCARCGGPAVERAIAAALGSAILPVRVAGFEALAQRATTRSLSPALVPLLTNALGDPTPIIRGLAARTLGLASPNAAHILRRQLDDSDPTVRAEALKAAGRDSRDARMAGLGDPAPLVRRTALQLVLDHGNDEELAEALKIAAAEGAVDVIRTACALSERAGTLVLSSLLSDDLTLRQVRTALDGLADAR